MLEHEDGYQDVWDPLTRTYTFRGHDSVTSGTGRRQDQRVMYDSGRLSDNGKFLKAAHAYATRERTDPLQVQVYEKIASGVWFDKGIFNLIGVNEVRDADRLVYVFAMQPANFEFLNQDRYNVERFLPAATKASVYQQADGRCVVCGIQQGLRFVPQGNEVKLLCPAHRGEVRGLLG